MAIDKTNEFWKGEDINDLKEYIKVFSSINYPADDIIEVKCNECENTIFNVTHEPDEGFTKLTCTKCKKIKYICDCDELESEIKPKILKCICKSNEYEIAVGLSYRKKIFIKTDIKWITVGARCIECGLLGSPADWKIDYSPSLFLKEKI